MSTQHVAECPELGPICDVRDEPPQIHDQDLALGELRLGVAWSPSATLSLSAELPLRLVSTSIRYTDLDGREKTLDYVDLHHRDEVIAGPGDPLLAARLGGRKGPFSIGTRLGLSLPLGRTEADPFRAADEDRSHQHIQLGTGIVMPLVGVELARAFGETVVGGFASAQLGLAENQEGYQPGHRGGAGVFVEHGPADALRLRGGVDVQGEGPERWSGTVHSDDGNQGRVDVLVVGGVALPLGRGLEGSVGVKVPVYTYVVGGQLDFPALVELGISRTFELGDAPARAPASP